MWTFLESALRWEASIFMCQRESWWRESLRQIMNKEITYVRVTHIRNTKTDYPAYRTDLSRNKMYRAIFKFLFWRVLN